MKYLEQKPGRFWWTGNRRYLIYMIRELSALPIAIYVIFRIFLIVFNYSNTAPWFGYLYTFVSYLGLTGALIHTLTWLPVMPKVMPFRLGDSQSRILALILFAFWIGLSYVLTVTINNTGFYGT